MTCYFAERGVHHISGIGRLFFPCSYIALPVQLERGNKRVGRERCTRTVTVRHGGDKLGVMRYAGTVSCSLSQLFILSAGIFLKQILPCVLRLGFIE